MTFKTYDSSATATVSTEPYLALQINSKTKYIGFTKDFDSHKASPLHFKIDNEEYALRKYTVKDFSSYMSKVYPSTYQTMTELSSDFPDMSDATVVNSCFYNCYELLELTDDRITLGKATELINTFRETIKLQKLKDLDYSNITTLSNCWFGSGLKHIGVMNTIKCTNFKYAFRLSKIEIVDGIDLSSVPVGIDDLINYFHWMFQSCPLKKVTFNNVPADITESKIRSAASINSNAEIILNYRTE